MDKRHELYHPINKKIYEKMKTETDPVLVLDTFAALKSNVSTIKQLFNQISFISNVQRAKQKRYKKPLN